MWRGLQPSRKGMKSDPPPHPPPAAAPYGGVGDFCARTRPVTGTYEKTRAGAGRSWEKTECLATHPVGGGGGESGLIRSPAGRPQGADAGAVRTGGEVSGGGGAHGLRRRHCASPNRRDAAPAGRRAQRRIRNAQARLIMLVGGSRRTLRRASRHRLFEAQSERFGCGIPRAPSPAAWSFRTQGETGAAVFGPRAGLPSAPVVDSGQF